MMLARSAPKPARLTRQGWPAAAFRLVVDNSFPIAPPLLLGDLTINTGLVLASTDLLAGATDADGDTLTITGVTAISGGTVTGAGPWTITPTAEGAGSATAVISDGRGGSVNRTVSWNGVAAAGLSGGDAALGWTAPDLSDGSVVTLLTDGTYDFGPAPTAVAQLGFGQGWLYDQPLLTVAADGTVMDGIVATEGGARRVELVDGIRVLASRIHDPDGWGGLDSAGRNISYALGAVSAGTKVAMFQSYKTVSPQEPLNWQFKNVRIQNDPAGTDGLKEMAHFAWRGHNYVIYRTAEGPVQSHYETVQPHANYGWQAYGIQFEYSTPDVADGEHRTMLCRQDDPLGIRTRSQLIMSNQTAGGGLPSYVVWQDYWDNSSGTTYPPEDLDQYLTDIQVQKGAWGAVMLADGPTPSTSRNAVYQPTVLAPGIAWSADEIKFRVWKQGRDWPAAFFHILNGETGQFVQSVPAWGTYVPPAYNWLTDMVGLYRPTVATAAGLRLSNTTLDPSAEDYVDYYIAFNKESDIPHTTTANSILCRGNANAYRSIWELRTDGSVVLKSEGNHTHTLCAIGAFPAANGTDCRWRLRMPKAAVGAVPQLWDETTNTRIDAGNALPTGWDKWIPTQWFIGGGTPNQGVNGTLYNVKAVGAQSGTLYDFRLNQDAGTPVTSPITSAHDESVTATIASPTSLSYVDHST